MALPHKPSDLARGAVFGAAALLLPILFHLVHLGHVFMPMYLPLMALAFFVPPAIAATTAIVVPLLSMLLTGMPPGYPPVAPIMSVELGLMAFLAAEARRWRPTLPSLAVLLAVLLLGRGVSFALTHLAASMMGLPAGFVAGASFLSGWPGVLLMLVVIPSMVRLAAHQRAGRRQAITPADPRREYFDQLAPRWNGFTDNARVAAALHSLLPAFGIKPTERVMDLGCGTGVLTGVLLETLGPDGRVVAVDFSPAMIRIAAGTYPDERATYLTASATTLPLKEGAVDRIICFNAWAHFPEPGPVLDELWRLLRPAGHLHIVHLISRAALAEVHGHAGGPIRDDVLPPIENLQSAAGRAGFRVLATEDSADRYLLTAERPA